jgi:hypothetical protein
MQSVNAKMIRADAELRAYMANVMGKIARDDPSHYFTREEATAKFRRGPLPDDAADVERALDGLVADGSVERVMKLYRARVS